MGDDEGELCTLVAATLPDALSLAAESRTVRLEAKITQQPSDQPQESQPEVEVADVPLTPTLPEQSSGSASQACRLTRARPQLEEGLNHFVDQVKKDYHAGCADMKDAFGKSQSSDSSISSVAGVATGVFQAVRFVPLRTLRLAARSAAAIVSAGSAEGEGGASSTQPTNSDSAADAEVDVPAKQGDAPATNVDPAATAEIGVPSEQGDTPQTGSPDVTAEAPIEHSGIRGEVDHFKDQVKQDFYTARDELKATFAHIIGPSGDASSAEELTGSQQWRHQLPAVASAFAGVSVAATLVPLRATRLAVASYGARTVETQA